MSRAGKVIKKNALLFGTPVFLSTLSIFLLLLSFVEFENFSYREEKKFPF